MNAVHLLRFTDEDVKKIHKIILQGRTVKVIEKAHALQM